MDAHRANHPGYHHKKTDDQPVTQWKPVRTLRRNRAKFLILICLVLGLACWHVFHSHSVLAIDVKQQAAEVARPRRHGNHARLHELLHDKELRQRVATGTEGERNPLDDPLLQQPVGHLLNNVEAQGVVKPVDDDESEVPKRHTSAPEEISDVGEQLAARNAQPPKRDSENELPNWKKGPSKVEADLDTDHEKSPVLSAPDTADRQKVIEAESEEHLVVEQTAENLPEVIHVPFEEAIKDFVLEGWEDDWVSRSKFDNKKWTLQEPKIDFVYLWVNGSEEAFQETKRPFEENSILNDPEGTWISSHGVNRYRDWDELRYAVRSVEKHAQSFRNRIQIIVNSVRGTEAGKQVPTWLDRKRSSGTVEVISQEDFMEKKAQACLPTFNSLTIENQLFNTKSDTDYMFALSDDMLLGQPHAASDLVSPLLGPVLGFKTNQYNTIHPPTEEDAHRFGEKPFLIYTSWLLNRRFGSRKRKGQGHFGHILSRDIMREAIGSFPGPELESACKRFRGEPGFQLYSWFVTFHYLIERHREAMLWSLIMLRSDVDGDGYLSWEERKLLMSALEIGMKNEGKISFRKRTFYHIRHHLEKAGLEAPKINTDFLWTSQDGPSSLINLKCSEFEVNECLGPGFSVSMAGYRGKDPSFSAAVIFERVARQKPDCGDCLLKLVLNQVKEGLEPVLPDKDTKPVERELAVKALMRYKYTIVEPNGLFTMLTDAEQIDKMLTGKYVRHNAEVPGQLCLNDDVATTEESELLDIQHAMNEFYEGLFPEKSLFEL